MENSAKLSRAGNVLIVDDDEDTRWLLKRACQTANYAVSEAWSGQEALKKLRRQSFDVMLLDLQLPDMYGVEVLGNVGSRHPDLITIILTANPSQDSAIAALKRGAADYLCKPTEIRKVLNVIATKIAERAERQKRLLELGLLGKERIEEGRSVPSAQGNEKTVEGPPEAVKFRLDESRHEVQILGEESRKISLTENETAVMGVFIERYDEVLSNQDIAFQAWGDDLDPDHAASIIRPLIFRLRHKLEKDPSVPRLIRTVRGSGYVFDPG